MNAGRASHSRRVEKRTTSTESSNRPTTRAPQKMDSAEPATASGSCRSSCKKRIAQLLKVPSENAYSTAAATNAQNAPSRSGKGGATPREGGAASVAGGGSDSSEVNATRAAAIKQAVLTANPS